MIKVLIADDEARIRRGIKGVMNWEEYDFSVVGEAEDGEVALEIAKETKPELLLLDICMPFLNGLDLIEELNEVLDNPVIIIISGHDEFKYAQAALQLKVFDYLLKPIERTGFKSIILKAKDEILKRKNDKLNNDFMKKQLQKSDVYLKSSFMADWFSGKLNKCDIENQLNYFNINISQGMGLIVIKVLDNREIIIEDKWNKGLLYDGVENITKELLNEFGECETFIDSKKRIVAVSKVRQMSKWTSIPISIENEINRYLNVEIIVEEEFLSEEISEWTSIYKNICEKINDKLKKTPIVLEAQKYIDRNYCSETLSMSDIAENIGVSQTYITRLLKKELGMTFIDYLTIVRIKNAMVLMEDPNIKIYEIAELVGYSTQHYFSNVFKKHMGISPIDYKRGINNGKNI